MIKKKKIFKGLWRYFYIKEKIYIKKKWFHFKVYRKIDTDFWPSLDYRIFTSYSHLRNTFLNRRYFKIMKHIRKKNYLIKIRYEKYFKRFSKSKMFLISDYIYLYNVILLTLYNNIFYFFKKLQKKKPYLPYRLILTFRSGKFFVNLLNPRKKNYLSLSNGLFIKFFNKKKSLRKGKTLKLLTAKYLRKIFLIIRLQRVVLYVKKIPSLLPEVLNHINQPILHKFPDLYDRRIIDETENKYTRLKFLYFVFLNNKSFVKNKTPKRGRVKRKIYRKVVFENNIID